MTTTPNPTITAPAARLRGKTAIVTGAPRSIGAAIAAALAAEGADVAVHYLSRREHATGRAVKHANCDIVWPGLIGALAIELGVEHRIEPGTSTRAVATAFFDAWQSRDVDAFRELLADDVTFTAPAGRAAGVEACVAGFRRMSELVTGVDVQHLWVDGSDALVWFQVHRDGAEPVPAANWMHVQDGRVDRIRVTLDLLAQR